MPKLTKSNALWLAIVVISFGVTGFVAAAVQQNYRLNANDPQTQMAEDAAAALVHGQVPSTLVPAGKVDITHSLAPFVVITNRQLHILATNATAPDPGLLLPPVGVFTDVAKKGELRFTWQTATGQRFATVVVLAGNDFVVTARSLKEVENREDQLRLMTVATWVAILLVVGVLYSVSPSANAK